MGNRKKSRASKFGGNFKKAIRLYEAPIIQDLETGARAAGCVACGHSVAIVSIGYLVLELRCGGMVWQLIGSKWVMPRAVDHWGIIAGSMLC